AAVKKAQTTPRGAKAGTPPWQRAREVLVMCAAIAVIFGTIAGSSWWLLQHYDLPFADSAGPQPTDTGAPRLSTITPRLAAAANNGAPTACTPATEAAMAARAASSARYGYVPLDGSWVAAAPTLHVRFFGMPWWDDRPTLTRGTRYAVGTVPGVAD